MKITIESIPYDRMRYPQWGDWYTRHGVLNIKVSNTEKDGEPISEDEKFLFAIHELVEYYLCKKHGVTEKQVDEFDMNIFPTFGLPEEFEAGDHPDAPYRKEHRAAMLIEHQVAAMLGMDDYGVIR